ncbi:MAG TPA: L-aspartate oxidase, partial [Alphaproteobacteria bacterium]|nr:L-aspartate oxidase [Alphaproteobacteria bacterium]
QFHPTGIDIGRDPAPLATEALRGEGAALINQRGERFMLSVHPDAELAPRDVVARGIFREIKAGRRVYLDARQAVGARFADAFPTVFAACQAVGINPALAPIPVAPAAHYHMGGLATDDLGRTTVNGLWAVGECASTGVHGANRLASNSLLEAVVFGARAAADMDAQSPPERSILLLTPPALGGRGRDMKTMRQVMTRFVGLERDGVGLAQALAQISALMAGLKAEPMAQNQAMAALLIAAGAYQRTESRGGHFRTDYRRTAPDWAHRTFLTLKDALSIAERARAEQGSGANALFAAAGT